MLLNNPDSNTNNTVVQEGAADQSRFLFTDRWDFGVSRSSEGKDTLIL